MATLAANSASRCDGHRVADEQPLARRSNASTARLCSRVCLVVVIVLAMCLSVDAAKQKKVKTTFKALKCSACKAVAEETKQEVKHEWDSRAGDTILIEKRKKKTKVSYVESELSVQEALDRICSQDGKFNMYNVSSVDGKPEYTKMSSTVGKKEYTTQLQNMCQTLMAEHESEIVQFFHKNAKEDARQNIWTTGQKEICSRF